MSCNWKLGKGGGVTLLLKNGGWGKLFIKNLL
jgi:hypothetical protein